MVKKFYCGMGKCSYVGTRKGLREHMKEEHRILTELTNSGYKKGYGYTKQKWWKDEEM